MTIRPVRLGDELQLERIPIEIHPDKNYIQIGIRSFGKGIFQRDEAPGDELSKLRYFAIQPGRLIVSNIMAWEGAIAVSSFQEEDCIGSSRFLSYAPSSNVDIRYINYYFQSEQGRSAIRGTSTGTVLRNQTLSIKDFGNLVVPLPEPDEQRDVADYLDSAMAKIQQVEQLREKRARLQAAFAESLISSISTEVAKEATVGEVMKLTRRPIPLEDNRAYHEIGIRSFGRGIFHKEPITGRELGNKRVFSIEPGDLVFSNVFAWEGAVAVAGEAERGRIGSHRFMTYMTNSELADTSYLRHYFTTAPGLEIIRRASPGSTGRNRTLGIKNFEAQAIPLPSLSEQRRIGQQLDALTSSLTSNQGPEVTKALRPALLNTAFSGQL